MARLSHPRPPCDKQAANMTDNVVVLPVIRIERYGEDDGWNPMETAPRTGEPILVRRHNDVMYEFYVVWWGGEEPYLWQSEHTAYPAERLDEWHHIPGARS
jgi:hypothetical protein